MGEFASFVFWALVTASPLCAAIIGNDDRIQFFEESRQGLRNIARSTAVLISDRAGLLEKKGSGFQLTKRNKTFKIQDNLCDGEPFAEEPTPGYCSGFLIGDDLLATAAHCVDSCEDMSIVFDFLIASANHPVDRFSEKSVYHCKSVVKKHDDEDWALLRLDRKTEDRALFQLARQAPTNGTELTLLGFPRGLPLKIAGSAKVVENVNSDPKIFLEAMLDAFGGNSGGPVVNSATLEVEGILSTSFGEFEDEEFEPVTQGSCRRLRRIPLSESPTPAWVVKTSQFIDAVQNTR